MVSFLMSVVWLAILTFVMVTLVSRTGCILNIDPYVMGLVIVAIGTSVPVSISLFHCGTRGIYTKILSIVNHSVHVYSFIWIVLVHFSAIHSLDNFMFMIFLCLGLPEFSHSGPGWVW